MNFYKILINLVLIIIAELLYYAANTLSARILGPADYGDLAVAIATLLTFGNILVLGVDILIIKFIPHWYNIQAYKAIAKFLYSIYRFLKPPYIIISVLSFCISLVFFVWLAGYVSFIQKDYVHPAFFYLPAIVIIAIFLILQQLIRACEKQAMAVLCDTLQCALHLMFVLLLWALLNTIFPFYFVLLLLCAYVISYILVVAFQLRVLYLTFSKLHLHIPKYIDFSWSHLLPSYTLQKLGLYAFTTIPLIILEILGHNELEVGVLAAILAILGLAFIPFSAISMFITPEISKGLYTDKNTLRILLRNIRMVTLPTSFITVSIISVFAKPLLSSFNLHFAAYHFYLDTWLLGTLVYGSTSGANKVIQLSKKGKFYGNVVWLTVLSSQIILGTVSSYFFGLIGLTVTNVISNILYFIMMYLFSEKVINNPSFFK